MSTSFHGWRRKAGCVVLVMALALMALWVRSRSVSDLAIVVVGQRLHTVCTSEGVVVWVGRDSHSLDRTQWLSGPAGGFDLDEIDDTGPIVLDFVEDGCVIPLPPIVMFVTPIAVCLILIPARKQLPIASQPDA
jgi:hypothetical protein